MAEARAGLAEQLEDFADNTMEYLKRERDLLLEGVGVPQLATSFAGRHVLIVVRGYDYKQDLASLRPYVREYRPVLIGVDGGADALKEEGYTPDLILGDMDSISDATLRCGAEVVVHAYPDGRAPGLARVEALGVPAVVFPAAGTSEDAAMLLADEHGAELIVAVGTHATLEEFLDKGRAGMASTFLTRLRVGSKLVDAKGVSRLYHSRVRTSSLVLLVLATLVTLVVAVTLSAAGRAYIAILNDKWHDFTFWLSGLLMSRTPGREADLLIDFRYHLVSIISVFLALAVGIVVGTTALNGVIVDDLRQRVDGLAADKRAREQTINEQQRVLAGASGFVNAVTPQEVAGQLNGRRVTLISAPGVSADVRSNVETVIEQAGATVTTRIRMGDAFADPKRQSDIESVATDAARVQGLSLDDQASDAQRVAEAFGTAVVGRGDGLGGAERRRRRAAGPRPVALGRTDHRRPAGRAR